MNENQFLTNKIEKPQPNFYEKINQEVGAVGVLLDVKEVDFPAYQVSLQRIYDIIGDFFNSGQNNDTQFLFKKLDVCNKLMAVQAKYQRIIEENYDRGGEIGEYLKRRKESWLLANLADRADWQLRNIFSAILSNIADKKIDIKKYISEASSWQLMELLRSCDFLLKDIHVDNIEMGKSFLDQYQKEIIKQEKKHSPPGLQEKNPILSKLKKMLTYSDSREYKYILAKMKRGGSRDTAEFEIERMRLPEFYQPDYFQRAKKEQIKSLSEGEILQYAEKLHQGRSFFNCLNGFDNFYSSFSQKKDKLQNYLMWGESDEELDRDYRPNMQDYGQCQKDLDNLNKLENLFFNILSKELSSISVDMKFDNKLIVKNGSVIAKLIADLIRHTRFNYYRKPEESAENQKVLAVLCNLAQSPKICRLINKYLDEEAKKFLQDMVADLLMSPKSIGDEITGFDTLSKTKGKLKIFGRWRQWAELNKDRFHLRIANLLGEARGRNKSIRTEDIKQIVYINRMSVSSLKPEEKKAEQILRERLQAYGLDVNKTIGAWETITEALIPYESNLRAIIQLEKVKPGIVKYLQENFNIVHFSRYPQELLIAQYEEQKLQRKKNPYVVILNPYSDYNGAFENYGGNFSTSLKLYRQLKGQHLSLKVVEANDKNEIIEQLSSLYNSFGPAIGGFIGGHGTKDTINFGKTELTYDAKHELHKDDLTVRVKGLIRNFFEDNSTLVLVSCSTGVQGGIAEELSKIGLKVIGPDRPTHISVIRPSYDQTSGILDFQIQYWHSRDKAGRVADDQPKKVYRSGYPDKPRVSVRPSSSRQMQL